MRSLILILNINFNVIIVVFFLFLQALRDLGDRRCSFGGCFPLLLPDHPRQPTQRRLILW